MVEALLSILIVGVIAAGCYYAAHYVVRLRHKHDTLDENLKQATVYIGELESRVMMLESERDNRELRNGQMIKGESNGWDSLNVRS